MKHTTTVAVLVTALCAAALAGCGGAKAGHAEPKAPDSAAAVPVQVLPSAPDPRSIQAPTAAAPAQASAGPLPTGPTVDLSPVDAWTRAAAAMAGQKSASLTLDIRHEDGSRVHAVSSVAADGDCVGHFTEGGGRGEVIHVGPTEYLKGDRRLWEWEARHEGLSVAEAGVFAGVWVKGLAQLGNFDIDAMCSLSEAVGNVTGDFSGLKQERGPFTVAGRQAVSLTQTGATDSVTLYVPVTGPAVVLKAVQKGDGTITTTFADLGRPVHAKAPARVVG